MHILDGFYLYDAVCLRYIGFMHFVVFDRRFL